jgi:hypothetical protein
LLGGNFAATGGDLMMLLAASFFSYYTVMSKPLIQRHGGKAVMAHCLLAGQPADRAGRPAGGAGRALGADGGLALGPAAVGQPGVGLPGLAGVGLGERDPWRGTHRAAAVPDAAGGRRGGLVGHWGTLHRPEDRRRGAHAGRRGLAQAAYRLPPSRS